ncbi:MAG: YceI family protein [Phycisphaerales bacterium]
MRKHRMGGVVSAVALGLGVVGGLTWSATAIAQSSAGAATYAADVVHSTVMFQIRHAGVTNFYGRFNDFTGSFSLNEENPAASRFDFTIQLESVDTGSNGRDDHLRSPDFFNVTQFPTSSFKSTNVRKTGEDTYEVTGELNLHGVTKPITATVTHTGTGTFRNKDVKGIEAVFQIKRSEFGITNYLAPDGGEGGGIGNTVTITVAVEGVKQ